jgi:ATP-dependent Clp protease ATP-binding subunit ClpA
VFERFDKPTVRVVHSAVAEAQGANAAKIGEEHLVYGLFRDADGPARRLTGRTVGLDDIRAAFQRAHRHGGLAGGDIDTLRDLGIDVEELVASVERQLGDNALAPIPVLPRTGWFNSRHLPLSSGAREVIAGALREAKDRGDRRIGDHHLLLSLLSHNGIAAAVLNDLGVSYQDVEARLADH